MKKGKQGRGERRTGMEGKNEGKDRKRRRMRERIGSSRRGERITYLEETNEEKERKQEHGKGEKELA